MSLEREVRFEEGCTVEGEVGPFCGTGPVTKEQRIEEEGARFNWKEEEEQFDEGATVTDEEASDGNAIKTMETPMAGTTLVWIRCK